MDKKKYLPSKDFQFNPPVSGRRVVAVRLRHEHPPPTSAARQALSSSGAAGSVLQQRGFVPEEATLGY